jgi:hypothetical protein
MLRHKTGPKFNNIGRKNLIRIHYNMDQSDKGSSLAATLAPLWQQKVLQQRRREKQRWSSGITKTDIVLRRRPLIACAQSSPEKGRCSIPLILGIIVSIIFVFNYYFCSNNLLLDYLKLILPSSQYIGPRKLAIGMRFTRLWQLQCCTQKLWTHILLGMDRKKRCVL